MYRIFGDGSNKECCNEALKNMAKRFKKNQGVLLQAFKPDDIAKESFLWDRVCFDKLLTDPGPGSVVCIK